jgi:hypothetical protein
MTNKYKVEEYAEQLINKYGSSIGTKTYKSEYSIPPYTMIFDFIPPPHKAIDEKTYTAYNIKNVPHALEYLQNRDLCKRLFHYISFVHTCFHFSKDIKNTLEKMMSEREAKFTNNLISSKVITTNEMIINNIKILIKTLTFWKYVAIKYNNMPKTITYTKSKDVNYNQMNNIISIIPKNIDNIFIYLVQLGYNEDEEIKKYVTEQKKVIDLICEFIGKN